MKSKGREIRSFLATAQVRFVSALWCLIGLTAASPPVSSQGEVVSNNRVGSVVDARVTFFDGTPVDGGFTAQLWGGPSGTPIELLQPLTPTTTFRGGIAAGYVVESTVKVPGVPANADATLLMRVYNGTDWNNSTCLGESNPVTVTLGSGTSTAVYLVGLQPFSVNCIPEPSTLGLLGCGTILGILWRRLFRAKRTRG